VAADPVLDDQSGIVHKAGFVMGHKGHIQRNGMGCNALVQGAVAILVRCANGTVSPGGLGLSSQVSIWSTAFLGGVGGL
jgi:hypothetical protein